MKNRKKFENKIVIVTGASSGIGFVTATEFAKQGATVILSARTHDKLRAAADKIRSISSAVHMFPADVSSKDQVQKLIDFVMDKFGTIDILVNNAGEGRVGRIDESDFVNDARHLLEVDFFGKVYCTQAVLPIMKQQGFGSIVNLSSVVGRKAFPRFGAYSATMHAVAAFSDALRQELKGTGIHVSTIHPALTDTAFFHQVKASDMPEPFRYMKPMTATTIAKKILKAVKNRSPRDIVPWQPRLLMLSDTISAGLGDLMVRWLAKPIFMVLIGMYRSRTLNANNTDKFCTDEK